MDFFSQNSGKVLGIQCFVFFIPDAKLISKKLLCYWMHIRTIKQNIGEILTVPFHSALPCEMEKSRFQGVIITHVMSSP